MNIYLPRFVQAAQAEAIRIALNEAGYTVDYIGHHPTDSGLTGPQIVNNGTPGPKHDNGAGGAWDIADRMLDTVPGGYRIDVTSGLHKRYRWSCISVGELVPTFRQAVAGAWADRDPVIWQCRPEPSGRYEAPWEDMGPGEEPLGLEGVEYRRKP